MKPTRLLPPLAGSDRLPVVGDGDPCRPGGDDGRGRGGR